MTTVKKIAKKNISALLDAIAAENRLFASVDSDGIIEYVQVENGDNVTLEFYNSKESPKKIFFPQSEILFSFSKERGREVPKERDNRQRVVFAMRPCDAAALLILDNVFDGADYKDPYYIEKRKNTVICSLGCNDPRSSCFCTGLGLGPYAKKGSDVFITDLGDDYLLEAVTEKGEQLLSSIAGLAAAEKSDVDKIEKLKQEAESKIKKQLNLQGVVEKLDDIFNHPVWEQIHEKCLGCGICTYLCPTCHCFDMADETTGRDGCRVRNWDSCMFGNFTNEASGHNPRPSGKERMRQRIMHKFNYFVKNFDSVACVGCGRCFTNCPVKNDIVKAIEKIKKVSVEK